MNIMDQRRQPGNFILEIADTGRTITASLPWFGLSSRILDLINKISLCSTLLTEVGREVNKNEELFKDNFQQKFEKVLLKCKIDNEIVLAAFEKANSWKKDDLAEDSEDPPKKPWKKLLWALGMTDDEFEEFDDSLDISFRHAMMTQLVVQLIILQIHAQQRNLTPSEQSILRRIKKNVGRLLEILHDVGVGSVMAFRLVEAATPVNLTQIAQAIDYLKKDSASTTTASRTIRNPSEVDDSELTEKRESNLPPAPMAEPPPRPKEPSLFEMYRVITIARIKKTIFRPFGIPFQIDRSDGAFGCAMEKIPATQGEILLFLEKNRGKEGVVTKPALESLMDTSPSGSAALYALMNTRMDPRIHQTHNWAFEKIIPLIRENPARNFWKKKAKADPDNFIVVLRGDPIIIRGPPPPPPPPPGWRRGPPVIKITNERGERPSSKRSLKEKKRKPAAQIELSQKESETLINDFLASFSTLYDDIPVEDRGAALDAIVLPEEDDSEYDSDSSSSSGSCSLVDD